MKSKNKPTIFKDLADLKVLKPTIERGNMTYDKDGKVIFTPTEDGNWLVTNDNLNK